MTETNNNIKVGDKVEFTYLKHIDEPETRMENGVLLQDFSKKAERYQGTVSSIRDLTENPLASSTLRYSKPKAKRSKNLVYLELEDGDIQAFYDGSMIVHDVQSKPNKRGVWNLMASAFKRRKPQPA